MQRVEFAFVEAVSANHTTRIIDRTVLEINGLRLAVLFAHATIFALVLVETYTQQRETREETQYRPDGANRVAVETAFAPREEAQY